MNKTLLLVVLLLLNNNYGYSTDRAKEKPEMSIYEAINRAGYQRMLTQRIAKSYMAILAKIEKAKHKEHLKESANLFEENLNELKKFAPTNRIRNQFRYVEILWRNYKFIYSDKYTEDNALVILSFNDKILNACEDAVLLLKEYSNEQNENEDQETYTSNGRITEIIDMSGKQRMLSQRLLLFTIAKFHEIGNVETAFNESLSLFNFHLEQLLAYSENTEQINDELLSISEKWEEIEKNIQRIMAYNEPTLQQEERLFLALNLSEQILYSFDEIVFLYERLAEEE